MVFTIKPLIRVFFSKETLLKVALNLTLGLAKTRRTLTGTSFSVPPLERPPEFGLSVSLAGIEAEPGAAVVEEETPVSIRCGLFAFANLAAVFGFGFLPNSLYEKNICVKV